MSSCNLLPICFKCARFQNIKSDIGFVCEAFPNGIPVDILASAHDHRISYQGDNGKLFLPIDDRGQDNLPVLATVSNSSIPFGGKRAEDRMLGDKIMHLLASDPPTSEAQRRAMFAAKEGHSTLGIPQSVGKEFVEADPGGKLPAKAKDMEKNDWKGLIRGLLKFFHEESQEQEHQEGQEQEQEQPVPDEIRAPEPGQIDPDPKAAGVAFLTKDGKFLLMKRSNKGDHKDEWAFPGGMREEGENPRQCAMRESIEETGKDYCGNLDNMKLFDKSQNYHTFGRLVDDKFVPKLNDEHTDYTWADLTKLPHPIHPGVQDTLDKIRGLLLGDLASNDQSDEWTDEAREASARARQKKTPFEKALERTNKATRRIEKEKAKYGGLTAPIKEKPIQGPSIYDPAHPSRKKFDSAEDDFNLESRYMFEDWPVTKNADKVLSAPQKTTGPAAMDQKSYFEALIRADKANNGKLAEDSRSAEELALAYDSTFGESLDIAG